MWKKLVGWAFIGGIVFCLYFANTEALYRAEASFKEGVEKVSTESFYKELLGGIVGVTQPQTTSVMKSNRVLRPLAERLGMQVCPILREWSFTKLLRRYKESCRVERGLLLEDLSRFVFGQVHYDEEESIPFCLIFSNQEEYRVFDGNKKNEIAKGKVGIPCLLEGEFKQASFVLKSVPENLKFNQSYPFSMNPWTEAVGALRGRIKIKTDKDNGSILIISASHRDRHLAAEIVNELIDAYQIYLKTEYDITATEQLAYLEGKQEQIVEKMDQLFDQHMDYLSKNLGDSGFTGLEQELQSLLGPHHQMYDKLLSIDVELKRLDELEEEGKMTILVESSSFSQGFNQVVQRIQDLKQQRDLIELSLAQNVQIALSIRKDQLKEVRDARFAVERLIDEMDMGNEITSCDFDPALAIWAKTLIDSEEKEDFAEYLEKTVRLFSIREKMLQERFFHGKDVPRELEGMDLVSARSLFSQYNSKLDTAEANLKHYNQLKKQILNPHFDLASLSSVLLDPLSQKIIGSASGFEMLLKDEKHYSFKEGERWKEEVGLQRNILIDHIDQLILVEELNADLMRDKMSALQKISLDCINQQISVLQEQVRDALKERRKALFVEKEILTRKMEEINSSLAMVIPEKWRFEKWLEIKTAMVSKMMGTVTEVVESKTMANQLHHFESKPLDLATIPKSPMPLHLRRMFFLGAFAFSGFAFSLAFIRRLLKGFPADFERLKAIRFPVLGRISFFCDGKHVETPSGMDLELLRKISLFLDSAKIVGLIAGKGPDYSYALCENLGRRDLKSIVLRCDFLSKMNQEDTPGIFQLYKKELEELPIRQANGFDYVPAGGYTPFGVEMIQSDRFEKILSAVSKNYDKVFLFFNGPLSSVQSQAALKLCDKAIVTVNQEEIEALTPFIHWGYDEGSCRITFITTG